jgi:thiamine kinase-like enzyme
MVDFMSDEYLMGGISFDKLKPGRYVEDNSLNVMCANTLESLSRGTTRGPSIKGGHGGSNEIFGGDTGIIKSYIEGNLSSRGESKKPTHTKDNKTIVYLECLLKNAYGDGVEITNIEDLPTTRKDVKKVYFKNGNKLSQVWIFKSEPKITARELAIYHVINQQGIHTGKPIGFTPSRDNNEYPFDIAILGGVVEHAGDSYNKLIQNMKYSPNNVFKTAEQIVKTIAEYQVKLTIAQHAFREFGVYIPQADPEKELIDRFVKGLVDNPNNEAEVEEKTKQSLELISACKRLYQKQGGTKVISHGDIHTGNIVTIKDGYDIRTDNFGIIDWETIMEDNNFADFQDFWIHHQRTAQGLCALSYDYTAEEAAQSYISNYERVAKECGLEYNLKSEDFLIQGALWNLYEMFDPVRTDEKDIREKANYHHRGLIKSLAALEPLGFREDAGLILHHVGKLAKDYLKN